MPGSALVCHMPGLGHESAIAPVVRHPLIMGETPFTAAVMDVSPMINLVGDEERRR
jgi:hypothetical protein